jgi:carotenoid cleavage dioxygenase
MTTTAKPLYLRGHLAPVPDEIEASGLPVEGHLPPELTGRYLRNGPNPLPGQDPGHWFAGHGMLHGVRLRDGRAEWYRNRWVRTAALEGKPFLHDGGFDRTAVTANTHVVEHAGRLLALVENGFPYEVSPELETLGPRDFDGRLTTAMTAHPKTDPVTGDLHFFGYGALPPFLTYHRVSAAGELVTSAEVPVAGPTMMHDFAITDRHAVFLDLPMTFSPAAGRLPYAWDDSYGARLGVMPLDRPGEVRWVEVDPCYVFHVGNAWSSAEGISLDVARHSPADMRTLWGSIGPHPASDAGPAGLARLHRWTVDGDAVRETPLCDFDMEFPTVDDTVVGRANRVLYAVSDERGILKYTDGREQALDLGPDVVAGEAVFVPAAGRTGEDEGWLLSITTTRDGRASELLVLDATDLGVVARVTLPRGVPAGFHGSWIEDRP